MARSCGFWRVCFGWCLLLCILPSVEAGTKSVNVPSIADQVSKGTPSLSAGTLTMSSAIEGEYIPAPTKNVPVRGILGGTEFGLNTIKGAARGLVRGAVPAIIGSLALDALLKGLDWAMVDGAVVKHTPGGPVSTSAANGEYTWGMSVSGHTFTGSDPVSVCAQYFALGNDQITAGYFAGTAQTQYVCGGRSAISANRTGNHCPSNSTLSTTTGSCNSNTPTNTALTDQDFIAMDTWINNQDSKFVRDLLVQACVGSNNPNGCYQSLRQRQLDLRGPSSVDAGSTTTTSTHANADGTTSTTVTNTSTKYNLTYSPTTMTYTGHSTTTTTTNGKPGDTTTTDENPSDEAPSDDSPDDDVTPSPCAGTGCDGPAYVKLYDPTKDTKQKFLDNYASKVKSLPILNAASGFFTVTASAGCPSWSTTVSFDVYGYSFNTNLVFDFHCQPWFVSMAAYAKIVMSIVCAYLAFRQAILD